jgi:hypothetical protein
MARPRKKINPEALENLASLGFTMEEIAVLSDCSVDTLERRFADAIKKGRLKDKMSFMRSVRREALGAPMEMLDPVTKEVKVLPTRKPNLGFCALYSKLKGWYVERVESVSEVTSHEKVFVAEWGGKFEVSDADEKKEEK